MTWDVALFISGWCLAEKISIWEMDCLMSEFFLFNKCVYLV